MSDDSQINEPCRLKATSAEELDRSNRFAEAAARYYYDVSAKATLSPTEKGEALQHAVTCTVLAPSGSIKNRLLKNISKDERCVHMTGYPLIKSMFLERLIKPEQLTQFQAILQPHQREVDAEGSSTLQRAILEHNVLALARLYTCVSFDSVSQLFGVSPDQVERLITKMITNKCVDQGHGSILTAVVCMDIKHCHRYILGGTVDQIDGLVVFDDGQNENSWEDYVISVCDQTNKIGTLICQKFPDWRNETTTKIGEEMAVVMAVEVSADSPASTGA